MNFMVSMIALIEMLVSYKLSDATITIDNVIFKSTTRDSNSNGIPDIKVRKMFKLSVNLTLSVKQETGMINVYLQRPARVSINSSCVDVYNGRKHTVEGTCTNELLTESDIKWDVRDTSVISTSKSISISEPLSDKSNDLIIVGINFKQSAVTDKSSVIVYQPVVVKSDCEQSPQTFRVHINSSIPAFKPLWINHSVELVGTFLESFLEAEPKSVLVGDEIQTVITIRHREYSDGAAYSPEVSIVMTVC